MAWVDPALADGDAAAGEALFRRCALCHSFDPAERKNGPHFLGVVGRDAAAVEGYDYSEALRQSGLVWTEEMLELYLADPQALVPGTRMGKGVADEGVRRDLIAYLKSRQP